jgi:HNH endonuclease
MKPVDYGSRPCEACGTPFKIRDAIKNRTQRFCSRACYWAAKKREQPSLTCGECGGSFTPTDAYQAKTRTYCSVSCARKAQWRLVPDRPGPFAGKKHSPESRARISASSRKAGRGPQPKSCPRCGVTFTPKYRTQQFCSFPCARRTKGGRIVSAEGYVKVLTDGGRYRLEHRLVMETTLGRPLLRSEEVHHINGIKSDNRPENLEIWHRPHGAGQRLADVPHCPTCTCQVT